jgi:hypothetical protein
MLIALALVATLAAGGGVTAVVLIRLRRRCPRCHGRGLVARGVVEDGTRHKRVVCVRCKAEFAHIDGGYVPLPGTVVLPEATAHDRA